MVDGFEVLAAFKEAGVDIPYRMATPREIAREGRKFTTTKEGTSILIRGGWLVSLESRAEKPMTRAGLAVFLEKLADSLLEDPQVWENDDLERLLRAWSAWLTDMEGYFLNRGEPVPQEPSWQLIAQMPLAARVYE